MCICVYVHIIHIHRDAYAKAQVTCYVITVDQGFRLRCQRLDAFN